MTNQIEQGLLFQIVNLVYLHTRVVLKMKMLQNWLAIVWEVPIGTLSNHKKN